MNTFQVGTTYQSRVIGDCQYVITETVAKRTAKTVTTKNGKTFRIWVYEGVEQISPEGRYSGSPVLSADRVKV